MTAEPETVESLILNMLLLSALLSICVAVLLVAAFRHYWFAGLQNHFWDVWDRVTIWWWKRRYR